MRILIGERWEDGYLDEHRPDGAVRVRVAALATVARLDDLYFVRERSWRTVLNHLRQIGPVWVVRKVLARSGERSRNEKFASVGLGTVLEAGPGAGVRPGDAVAFLAPCHPRAFERVVLPPELVVPVPGAASGAAPGLALTEAQGGAVGDALTRAFGWSPHAGSPLPRAEVAAAIAETARDLAARAGGSVRRLPVEPPSPVGERDPERPSASRPTAVLFGYGNYGKTVVLHGVKGLLDVRCVHELDPTLMPASRDAAIRWDTAGVLRSDERYDVHLIAAFHHAHVPLAVSALSQGATAVVEKPIATDRESLAELLAALEATGGRLLMGFHKRYAASNAWARADLGVPEGAPIDYHAVVFEEPLPARHWYRWPSARSRIVSNGCHWLDHFLFLNAWSPPAAVDVARGGRGGEIANVSVRLENGAFFSMLLTDAGSPRLGVRDHVELRAGGVTVAIDDGSRYRSEDRHKVLRRRSMNRMTSYETMYRTIASRIVVGEPGDSIESVRTSGRLVLDVEEAYRGASEARSRVAR